MKIINLTEHPIHIYRRLNSKGAASWITTIEPSGEVARVALYSEQLPPILINGIEVPITRNTFGEVYFVPPPQGDTIYIVSKPVAQRLPERDDLYVVNNLLRDKTGKVLGCQSLSRLKDDKIDLNTKPRLKHLQQNKP